MKTVGKIIVIPRGQYNATAKYTPLDMVFLENNSWVCKKEVTGVSPSDKTTEYWYRYTDIPSGGGMTEEQAAQLKKNTEDISKLSSEIDDLKENGTSGGSSDGVSTRYKSMMSKFTLGMLFGYANDESPLDISTYDGNNQTTHPKVLYFKNGWNGYKYWMCHSPYPGSNASYENPCIAYSNDGINWLDTGISNPLDTQPTDESGTVLGYNSDPTLVMNGNTMEVWWRQLIYVNEEYEYFYRRTSTDGINWSEKEQIFRSPDAGQRWMFSPCVIYEDGVYKIWVVRGTGVSNCMRYYESTDGTNWTFVRDIVLPLTDDNSTYWLWHMDILKTSKGYEFVGCYRQDGEVVPFIYYSYSTDNVTYAEPKLILKQCEVSGNFDDYLLYRPSLVYDDIGVKLYYGTMGSSREWHIGLVEAPTIKHLNVLIGGDGNTGENTSGDSSEDSGDTGESGGNTGEEETPNATLTNITATFTQGESVYYPTSEVSSLKENLVVTANYNDGTSATVTDYSLSGAFSVGTSTFTVTYEDMTTTFDVVVSEEVVTPPSDLVNVSEMYTTVPNSILSSFANTALDEGYINDSGVLTVESGLNLHTTEYLDVSEAVYWISSELTNPYIRFSLYDENKNYLGKKAGIATLKTQYFIAPNEKTNAKYMRISFNSDTISDITLKVYKYAKFETTDMTQVKLDGNGVETTSDGNDYLTPLLNVECPFIYGCLENLNSSKGVTLFGYDNKGNFVKVIGNYTYDGTVNAGVIDYSGIPKETMDAYGAAYVKIGYNTNGGTNFLAILKEVV